MASAEQPVEDSGEVLATDAEALRAAESEDVEELKRLREEFWGIPRRGERILAVPLDLSHLLGTAQFVSAAVASGVVGNLAYDALKIAVRKRSPALKDVEEEELLPELVFHATIEQCRRYDLPVPQPDRMRVDKWVPGERSVTAFVSCLDSEMTAEVTVPRRWSGSYVEVRIRDVSQRRVLEPPPEKTTTLTGRKRLPLTRWLVPSLLGLAVFVLAVVLYQLLR